MTERPSPSKSSWAMLVTMATAVAVFALLWVGALLVFYPRRANSPGFLVTALSLDLVPVCLHAVALSVTGLVARRNGFRIGLALALGLGTVLVPWGLRTPLATLSWDARLASIQGVALGAVSRALGNAMFPAGDLLGGAGGRFKRLAGVSLAVACGTALASFFDAGFRFQAQDWGLSLLREAPFVWAWMSVPPPDTDGADPL